MRYHRSWEEIHNLKKFQLMIYDDKIICFEIQYLRKIKCRIYNCNHVNYPNIIGVNCSCE